MLIGERTAEDIKVNIGSAFPRREEAYMEVTGRNLDLRPPQDDHD